MLKKALRVLKNTKSAEDHGLDSFFGQYNAFEKLDINKRFPLLKEEIFPCLNDNTGSTPFDAHYIYHPAWAARIVREINPDMHIDISSTLHFCSILSAFIKTEFYDYRPAALNLANLASLHADLTSLHFADNSILSLSCMHTLEHIGLGRYGDPLNPDGDLKAFGELKRVCAPGGNLLIVVPVGVKRLQFNAHRIYNPFEIIGYMDGFSLKKFSLIDDQGGYTEKASLESAATQKYGCGCYWFIKNIN
jgi:SAM-dependent methyltransferase